MQGTPNNASAGAAAYNPSPVILTLKTAASLAEKLLPSRVYNPLYATAFGSYKKLVRFVYLRHWFVARHKGNRDEANKARTIYRVMPYSLVGQGGLSATYDIVSKVEKSGIEGAIVECGVARGGCAALMALVSRQAKRHRQIWLFDSYEGLPDPTVDDFGDDQKTGHHVQPLVKGACLGTYEEVQGLLFGKFGLNRSDIHMVKGWFQDTLPITHEQIGKIAVLRLDGDWYGSTKCCLDNLFDQVVPKGWIIVDDYGSCYGAQKAVDEFLAQRGLTVDMTPDGRGGCYFKR